MRRARLCRGQAKGGGEKGRRTWLEGLDPMPTEEHGDHRDDGEPEAVRLRDLDDEAAHEASEGSGEHHKGAGPLDMVRHGDVELGGSCLASCYGCRLHA